MQLWLLLGRRRDLFCKMNIWSTTFIIVFCVNTPLALIVPLKRIYQPILLPIPLLSKLLFGPLKWFLFRWALQDTGLWINLVTWKNVPCANATALIATSWEPITFTVRVVKSAVVWSCRLLGKWKFRGGDGSIFCLVNEAFVSVPELTLLSSVLSRPLETTPLSSWSEVCQARQ